MKLLEIDVPDLQSGRSVHMVCGCRKLRSACKIYALHIVALLCPMMHLRQSSTPPYCPFLMRIVGVRGLKAHRPRDSLEMKYSIGSQCCRKLERKG